MGNKIELIEMSKEFISNLDQQYNTEHFKVKKVLYDFKKKKIGDLVFKNLALDKYYTNSKGERVQSPTYYNSAPPGATALCRDGTYSFSKSRRGTCSHHGGVAKWLK